MPDYNSNDANSMGGPSGSGQELYYGAETPGAGFDMGYGYNHNPSGPQSAENQAKAQYVGGMQAAALNSGQIRPLYAQELYNSPNWAAQYARGADQMAQARLAQGMGMANRGMAAQALSRGSNPLAMRQAIQQGGVNAMEATNTAAQLQAQGMMGASQVALQQRQQNLGALGDIKQQQIQKYGIDKQAAYQKEALNAQKDQQGFDNTMKIAGAGMSAAGAIIGSDIRNKSDVRSMSPGTAPMTSIGTPMTGNEPSLGIQNYYLGTEGGPLEGLPRDLVGSGGGYAGQAAPMGAYSKLGAAMSGAGGVLMSDPDAKADAYRMGAEQAYERMMRAGSPAEQEALYADAMAERAGRLGQEDPALRLLRAGGDSRLADLRAAQVGAELDATPPPAWTERTPLDESLRAIKPYAFRYKPEAAAALGQDTGMRPGTMTRDLKRDPLTAPMVRQTPQGEAIDMPTAVSTTLAGVGRLAERVDRLEGQPAMEMPAAEVRADPLDVRRRQLAEEQRRLRRPWLAAETFDTGPLSPEESQTNARFNMRPLTDREELEWAYRQGRGGM